MKKRGYTLVELMLAIFGLCVVAASIALTCTMIYVAYHFIAKMW